MCLPPCDWTLLTDLEDTYVALGKDADAARIKAALDAHGAAESPGATKRWLDLLAERIPVDGWTLATSSTGRLYRINSSTGAESFVGETRDLNDRRILYTDLEALECLPSACGVNTEAFGIPKGRTSWTKHGCLIGYTKGANQLLLINPETVSALPISPGLDSAMSGGFGGMIFVSDEDDPASQ